MIPLVKSTTFYPRFLGCKILFINWLAPLQKKARHSGGTLFEPIYKMVGIFETIGIPLFQVKLPVFYFLYTAYLDVTRPRAHAATPTLPHLCCRVQ
jgi:hypothetical protein